MNSICHGYCLQISCFFVFVFFSPGINVSFISYLGFLVAPAQGHPAKTSHWQVVALWSWLVSLVLTNPAFRFHTWLQLFTGPGLWVPHPQNSLDFPNSVPSGLQLWLLPLCSQGVWYTLLCTCGAVPVTRPEMSLKYLTWSLSLTS